MYNIINDDINIMFNEKKLIFEGILSNSFTKYINGGSGLVVENGTLVTDQVMLS